MKISIHKVQALMLNAHKEGYEPVLTINGEYYKIDYKDKRMSERDTVHSEGRA